MKLLLEPVQKLLALEVGDGASLRGIQMSGWGLRLKTGETLELQPTICAMGNVRVPRFSIGTEFMSYDSAGIRDLLKDRVGLHFYLADMKIGSASHGITVRCMPYLFRRLTLNKIGWDNPGKKSRVCVYFTREEMGRGLTTMGKTSASMVRDSFTPGGGRLGEQLVRLAKEGLPE